MASLSLDLTAAGEALVRTDAVLVLAFILVCSMLVILHAYTSWHFYAVEPARQGMQGEEVKSPNSAMHITRYGANNMDLIRRSRRLYFEFCFALHAYSYFQLKNRGQCPPPMCVARQVDKAKELPYRLAAPLHPDRQAVPAFHRESQRKTNTSIGRDPGPFVSLCFVSRKDHLTS